MYHALKIVFVSSMFLSVSGQLSYSSSLNTSDEEHQAGSSSTTPSEDDREELLREPREPRCDDERKSDFSERLVQSAGKLKKRKEHCRGTAPMDDIVRSFGSISAPNFKSNSRLGAIFSDLLDSIKKPEVEFNPFIDYYHQAKGSKEYKVDEVPYIFVYGTLRHDVPEKSRSTYWEDLNSNKDFNHEELSAIRTPGIVKDATLYGSTRQGYPFMVLNSSQPKLPRAEKDHDDLGVVGELIELRNEDAMTRMLEIADRIEGFRINGPKNYWRTIVNVELESGKVVKAWAYVVKKHRVFGLDPIKGGDWVQFKYTSRDSIEAKVVPQIASAERAR